VDSYTSLFIKQERIDGKLQEEQHIAVKFRPEPYSLAMLWKKNAPGLAGDAMLYVEGKYQDDEGRSQMVVRPTNRFFRKLLGGHVKKLPDCASARRNSLRRCTEFGFDNSLQSLRDVYMVAKERNECKEEYEGTKEIAGRNCIVLVRYLTADRPDYPAWKTLTYIDIEDLIPVCVTGHDRKGNLLCSYRFEDISFDTGLSDEDFTPSANGISVK